MNAPPVVSSKTPVLTLRVPFIGVGGRLKLKVPEPVHVNHSGAGQNAPGEGDAGRGRKGVRGAANRPRATLPAAVSVARVCDGIAAQAEVFAGGIDRDVS